MKASYPASWSRTFPKVNYIRHYTFNDKGIPNFTPQGTADLPGSPNVPWVYCGTPAPWLFSPGVPEYARFASVEENQMLDVGIADPTQGYYSPADARRGATLARLIFDRVSGIAAGRQPMSDLDQLVKDWKSQGGDEIRAEYEKAIAG